MLFSLLVNAPSIRPLIRKLGIGRLTDVERAELKRGSELAQGHARDILEHFRHAGILSHVSLRQASKALGEALSDDGATLDDVQRLSREWSDVLRAEMTALEEQCQTGIIPEYTFLDQKGELQRRREQVVTGDGFGAVAEDNQSNPFPRLENSLVHWLREKNWAAPMLARYQNIQG